MTEADVALTDFAVAVECAAFTALVFRAATTRQALRRLFAIFFGSIGIAALIGGAVHGFVPDDDSIATAVLWRLTLLSMGLATFALWGIGGRLLFSERNARIVQALAGLACVAYATVVLAVDQDFRIAVLNYAPSIVFFGIALVVVSRKTHNRNVLAGLFGVLLTIVAAIVQQRQIAFPLAHLSHNAVYHLIQMVALGLIFQASRHLISAPTAPPLPS